jgi:hypothetical protein
MRVYYRTHPEYRKKSSQRTKMYRQTDKGKEVYYKEAKKYRRTTNGKYTLLKSEAKSRGIDFDITFEEYVNLNSSLCFYCGGLLPEAGYGLDRINNNIGYVSGNCRPCCIICNRAKSTLTENEFKEWSLRLFNHWLGEVHDEGRKR